MHCKFFHCFLLECISRLRSGDDRRRCSEQQWVGGTIQRLRGFLQVVRMRMLGSQILVHWRARRCWCLWPNCCAKSNFARLSPLPPLSKEQEEQAAASPATALCFLLCLCWPDCHWASFDSSQPPAQYVSSSDQICVRTVSSRGHLLGWS